MHVHIGGSPIMIAEDSDILKKLSERKPVVLVDEGYQVFDLNYPSKIIDTTGKLLGQAQVVGVIPTRITFLHNLKYLPTKEIFARAGYVAGEIEALKIILRESLFERYRKKNKSRIDWISVIFAIQRKEFDNVSRMHIHLSEPVTIDGNYFKEAKVDDVRVVIEEGYRIFDLDKPTEIRLIGGQLVGYGQILASINTRVSFLNLLNFLGLPVNQILKLTGHPSKEFLNRWLGKRYLGKHDVDWISIEIVQILEKSKFL